VLTDRCGGGRRGVATLDGLVEIVDDTLLPLDVPLVVAWPAVEEQAHDGLTVAVLIGVSDVGVGGLDHPCIAIIPTIRQQFVELRDVGREVLHARWDDQKGIQVGVEAGRLVLKGWAHLRCAGDVLRVARPCVGMDGVAVAAIRTKDGQHLP
jgi:hypothetical protein